MMTGLSDARLWLDLGQWLITLGLGLYVWINGRQHATRTQIADVEKAAAEAANGLAARVTRLETAVEVMPRHDTVHELALSVKDLAGEVKALNARHDGMFEVVKRLETITNRQEDHLLNRGSRTG